MDFDQLNSNDFDLSSLGDLDMSSIDLSGLDGLDLGNLDLGNLDLSSLEGLDLSSIDLGDLDFGGGGSDINGLDLGGGGGSIDLGSIDPNAFSLDDIDSMINDAANGVGDFFDPSAPLLTPDGVDESLNFNNEPKVGSSGYYDEETGEFIYDENGGLRGPLDETSGTNKESMNGYTYDKKTGTWTTPSGGKYTPGQAPSHTAKTGAQVKKDAGIDGKTGTDGKKGTDGKTGTDAKTGTGGSGGGSGSKDGNLAFLLPLLLAMMAMNRGGGGSSSNAVIPSLSADRRQLPYGPSSGAAKRPGAGGTTYFSPMTYTQKAAGGGMMYGGGGISNLGGYSDGGRLLRGPGDGVSDSIPATIGGKQPARLATGEFVVPARIVSELGNGSTEAGAKKLYAMMDRVQKARRKTKNVAADTKAHKYLPA
jgi:hypothetical protein